jgi:hypothetical protein
MITIVDHNNQKVKVPVCWEETNTDLFQRYVKEWDLKDRILLFSIQSGYDYATLKASTDPDLQDILDTCTDYVFKQWVNFEALKHDPVIKIRGKMVAIPPRIENLTIEQNLVIKNAMEKATDLKELISLACAVYLQPIYDKSTFDHDRYKELEKYILTMPILETFPIGFFLLSRLNRTGKGGFLSWRKAIQQLTLNVESTLNKLRLPSLHHSMTFRGLTNTQKPTGYFHGLQDRSQWMTLYLC